MRKYALLFFLTCTLVATAQKKNSFSLAMNGSFFATPSVWHGNSNIKKSGFDDWPFAGGAIELAYYNKNEFSAKIGFTGMSQSAIPITQGYQYENFIDDRQLQSLELAFGKSFLKKTIPHAALWTYAGVGYAFDLKQSSSNGTVPYEPWEGKGGHYDEGRFYPTVNVMAKYNPVRFVFIGIGGTYRYFYKDFMLFSGDITIGFQL